MRGVTILRIAILLLLGSTALAFDGKPVSSGLLASTPPMGWNSWNKFGCNVSEDLIRQVTDAMVTSGMKDAGYDML